MPKITTYPKIYIIKANLIIPKIIILRPKNYLKATINITKIKMINIIIQLKISIKAMIPKTFNSLNSSIKIKLSTKNNSQLYKSYIF